MRRGGWRNHTASEDGWGAFGYMAVKAQKLDEQFRLDAPLQQQKDGTATDIFNGVSIYVNGYTDPTADQLRHLMMLHGGQFHVYYSRSKTTHIIATNLPNSKIKELKDEKVVRPEWITESIQAGRLLSYVPYQLYTKQSSVQKCLNFTSKCKPEDPFTKDINNKLSHSTACTIQANGTNGWEEDLEKSEEEKDFEIDGVENFSDHNREQNCKDSSVVINGHNCSPNGALKPLDISVHSSNSFTSRLHSLNQQEKTNVDSTDCTLEQLQPNNGHLDVSLDPHRTESSSASSSYLHNKTKLNGAHHSLQGPSSTKSTTIHLPTKAASPQLPKTADSNFISDFYSHSRLHHISTWKCEFTEFVRELQSQHNGSFPGRERLKKIKSGTMPASTHSKCQNCIIHVDMDCFFVSVGVRNRPDLKGKPVAVTSNRGSGKINSREGTNPQLEMQYYQNKLMRDKTDKLESADCLSSAQINGHNTDFSVWDHPDLAKKNGLDIDNLQLSFAEIASCSYEARQAGVRNGMMFGKAKQLCPDLQVVPYDFEAYKEVALTLYKTLASYTHDIEAVSCDEALVDITEVLAETKLSPDEVASAIRAEIKEKTLCAASIGMGSNILLARMATRKAKPDGQYHLKLEEVDDFISGQLVTTLPGVGRSMEYKLSSLNVKTCGDLQNLTMSKLQKEFGPKTGQMLYRFCRGLDDRPIRKEKERKSVSAEINYGIRFTKTSEAEAFLINLSEEIQRRLESVKMKGKKLTLKIMVRKAGAPVESAKFGGHGICDHIARSVTLDNATDSAKVIGRETLKLFQSMKLNVADMRGVGLQMHQLLHTHVLNGGSLASRTGLLPGGSRSLVEMFQDKRKTKPAMEEDDRRVIVAAFDIEISSASDTFASVSSGHKTFASSQEPSTSKAEPPVRKNGFHSPVSMKSRVNFTIEVPSPSQVDPSVLEALPPDIREQVEQTFALQQKLPISEGKKENGCSTIALQEQPVATVLLQIPPLTDQAEESGINVIALPAFSQVDPEVFAALPADLQEELRAAYGQRNKHPEATIVSKNPLQQLKKPTLKAKKRSRKKNQVSPTKKMHSPLKNKLFSSPAKNSTANVSPQKLKDALLKQEAIAPGQSQVEIGPSTSDVQGSMTEGCSSYRSKAPNLAGAIEFNDVKTLLREWITTISDPMEEDILQVVKYCTDLIEEKDLEKLDLVIKYMKRLMQQSVESVWNMAFDFILDNVQVVLQQTYGSTLKVV
ncbi:DNA repair protein REV1 [Hyla sarda]|uniref:DNA repair protein REV1 n=1 Tax=Hyla sarda TaxID=327740 RepID=UPI0024C42C10|nr:DNA repair protein REV1 [Hyla sarda]XP_056411943.1 DNA repair protein REV1 [Hyla sarda]